MLEEPTAHAIDPLSGAMSGASGRYEKKLSDLVGLYADSALFEAREKSHGQDVVYQVDEKRPSQAAGDLIFGTTWMQPGRIGDEFFMTRGHIHARGNRPETYYGESGTGVMLLESPEGEIRTLEIQPRLMVYVPPLWIHRSVNTGATPLVMSFCYPSDSGQNYDIIARSDGMACRVVADGTGWKTIPNASYRARSKDEIAAVYATCD
ncbi:MULTISPECIES: glucose-6-phosphate isomerase [Pacificibacter]|uniref:glucose-6-phosphate isomerase n=1 Tax=Pacificibacter TaxID=1042323 RepID=UPI001C09903B|nr:MULTISPECIES: glucose-6-phosphate isomerase [Pacificibacter]MBU2937159.1 glucose-6-phosphate isomerase [Pacificibacter marinus]MDO6617021.1 glucose-6-phosphate isomerase [Pacificibacter sp. 1_MG-2023]